MHQPIPADIDIARHASMLPIGEIAARLGIPDSALEPHGRVKAKISLDLYRGLRAGPQGKLVLVTAITPTPAGEGKTTTTIGLTDALARLGKKAMLCIREPSLGPCFGIKGGAAGGGYAQVVPMEDINLHFTGDFHAIGVAHNLLSAVIDNHLASGNALDIDPARVVWRRVVDMNDRALRQIVVGLGGSANGAPRETGYDITVASEVMAVFCLSESIHELKERLGRMIVAYTRDRRPVLASQLKVHGAMAALLKDAIKPNLVQTLENNPALVHGGPFANIAHGCNSLIATRMALGLADYVVTEAGFGADLGAEKFLDIMCRQSGLVPDAVVLVATVRALKMHGGVAKADLGRPDAEAVRRGLPNLLKHLENIQAWGLPVVVAVNHFTADTPEETAAIEEACAALGVKAVRADHWARGGEGALDLAGALLELTGGPRPALAFTYPGELPLWEKVRTVARRIYGASDIKGDAKVLKAFADLEAAGFGHLPVCLAKTQYSFSTDPQLRGRPEGFTLAVRDVRVSAGAGFVVVLTGDIMTMPGLPKVPAAELIDIDEEGNITGLS
ncbi:formate--tetrahydrofolate ligase [Mesoterricola silvestris]|uniref:Formate--tetrahydrofolate ligase n=1 Tax=Mesoterricola silvestris TaxID=2927979 RepID=A0AA48GT41_9BACT|nr:formate--tetrahydrofolate ligase [Mesoterricola silvestris]BDU73815.1 formate--tetrahydrofolate ligase [Mesoterricola silvestris]